MGSKKKTKTTYKDTQTVAPPSWTAPGLSQTAGMVQNALGKIPTDFYNGQQVAYLGNDQLQAIQDAWGNTADLAGQYTGYMQDQLPGLMQGPQFSTQLPTGNFNMGDRFEGLNSTINAANYPVMQELMNNILPSIKSSSLDAGAYSGDRAMGVLPTQAIQNATDSMQRTAAQLAYQDYQDFENRRLAAWQGDQATQLGAYQADTSRGLGVSGNQNEQMQLLPQYIQSMLKTSGSVGDLLNMSGALGTQNQQAQINDAVSRDRYAAYSPFMGLDSAAQLLAQLSGNWGQTDRSGQSKTTESTGGLGSALQTAAGIAGAFMGMPSMGGGGLPGMAGSVGSMAPSASLMSAADVFQPMPLNIMPSLYGG